MIIEHLGLLNFGIYGGRHSFDLAPDPAGGKPIVLIEGHNGAGKTTFLEAIRLALYGKGALGPRVSQKAYEGYLLERLHRGVLGREIEIVLELRREERGTPRRYSICRRWTIGKAGHEETLTVSIDGQADADSSPEDQQELLNGMIPPGVSQLFFFDGEKIQDIAQGDASAGLQQAIGPLLGLDIVEQLRGDLALFVARQSGPGGSAELEAVRRELAEIEIELLRAHEKRAQLASECDQAAAAVRRVEAAFRKEGGQVAEDLEGANEARRRIEDERQELVSELRDLANGIGPFLLAPRLLERFDGAAAALDLEKAKGSAARLIDVFESQVRDQGWKPSVDWLQFRTFVAADRQRLPSWAEGRIDHLRTRIAAAASYDRRDARALSARLDDNLVQSQAASDQVTAFAAGRGDTALQAVRDAEFERGRQRAALDEQDAVVARWQVQRERTRARLDRLQDALFEAARLGRSIALASKARAVLIDYETRILASRIDILERHALACLHRLLRRPGLVGGVRLDPASFEVSLVDVDDRIIALDSLSAGERQLFAVALLWALAKTSERVLPLVIDTPMGRLDRTHRQRIVEQYLAGASEQVVLLCTDTELTREVAEQLRPFVSRHLLLGVGKEDVRTVATVLSDTTPAMAHAVV